MRSIQTAFIVLLLSFGFVGCSEKKAPLPKAAELATAKLAVVNRLAQEILKPNNDGGIFEALEDFRNTQYPPAEEKEKGKEIIAIYKSKIQGKYRGTYAAEIDAEFKIFETQLNK